jgi:predicted RNA-binding Zn ribbon-like protein
MPLSPEEFREKGHGKTAPWVDLVNSEEWDTYGKRTEWLDDPFWLSYFLEQWRLSAPSHASFPVAKFRQLRSVLRKSCEAIFAGRTVPGEELRDLNGVLNIAGKRQLIQRRNQFQVEFVPRSEGWDWVLAQLALSFANLLASEERSRIKICQNDDCKWVFYDGTKAQTRRWCSDKVCGNRERVRRARARMAR